MLRLNRSPPLARLAATVKVGPQARANGRWNASTALTYV